MRKNEFLIFITLLIVVIFILAAGCTVLPDEGSPGQDGGTAEPKFPQPKALTDPREIELNNLVQQAASTREDVLAFIIFRVVVDHVDFSKDGSQALVWIALVDKNTGLVQPGETGLVLARKTTDPANPWSILFQADSTFAQQLMSLPDDLLSPEGKRMYLPAIQQEQKAGTVYRGYRLPWTNGETVRLTGSIGHVYTYKSCPADCLYAFDFANGTMFPVRAARRGTVKYVVWDKLNGNTTQANYIVLEDTSTVPTTYAVYLHFAQNTIPPELRVIGAPVMQGQFIGNADDTGYSSGHHLHFHVHTNPTSYWGKSVDIVFDEVTINGGRPRMCTEANNFPQFGTECMPYEKYVSRNGDAEPPTGGITNPVPYATITSPTLNVSGWMKDDVAVLSGQLMYTVSGDWIPIGGLLTTSPFTTEINLCNSRIPNGKFFLSVEVKDQAGKTSQGVQGLTELTKNYECPPIPPVCVPADSQVALYSDVEYQGKCQLLEIGDYADMSELPQVKADQAWSIQVGAGVSALLFADPGYEGMMEFFQNGDDNLLDNAIGAGNAASVKVVARVFPPTPPTLSLPEHITTSTDLTLSWTADPGVETRGELVGPNGYLNTLDWQTGSTWPIGLLEEGDYTVTVESLNLAGTARTTQVFTVGTTLPPPSTHMETLPQITDSTAVMLKWKVDDGADGLDHFNLQWRANAGDWQTWPNAIPAALRQMRFMAVPDQTYEFRLRAVDLLGGEEDWPEYAEATTMVSGACGEDAFEGTAPGDDERATAAPMETGTTQEHNWCPLGDVDWIVFQGTAGQQLKLTTKVNDLASGALLQLYDLDGVTFIGEARPLDADSGAALDWTVPVDGVYTLKISPVEIGISGTDTSYSVGIEEKNTINPGTLICGSAAIPALLGGAYAVSKQMKKKKPKGIGW